MASGARLLVSLLLAAACGRALAADCPRQGKGGDPEINLVKSRDLEGKSPPQYTPVPLKDAEFLDPTNGGPCGQHIPKQGGKVPHYRARWHKEFWDCIKKEEALAISVEGYILAVKEQRSESVNCKDSTRTDLHIWMGESPGLGKEDAVLIVEPTPWTKKDHWTEKEVDSWKGRKVRVSGFKLYDQWHKPPRHRKTAWEIHPVLEIYDVSAGKAL